MDRSGPDDLVLNPPRSFALNGEDAGLVGEVTDGLEPDGFGRPPLPVGLLFQVVALVEGSAGSGGRGSH